ncbi:hybrid sensor histidine kinase/response regulator [uncultured Draconibacterium sp.]|uniref:hybrid sensor histidine kinase/response regulator n=1 Tax=uncultured Draconibacterium sp. TaxID=1573823 RepID=UPI0025E63561|nr:hybrid sensor histidine kinase/response regulator [uncultured Draconibacterium sp.]
MNNEFQQHLLVIDDEVEITKSIFRQFRRKYKVHTATNGNDAIKIMEEQPIQVVLSDQRMPGMTGVDFFNRIKNKYPDALKLILTGYSDIEAVVGAINEGQVFRYLTKPWSPVELDLAIKEAFEKHELITNNKKLLVKLKEANAHLEEKVKERTHELESANNRLKHLNIEKNKYVGIVAHDLRNPIGNAYNFSELLVSDFNGYPEKEKMEFLKIINDRCAYSLKLIEDFLDTSKIESGILDLDFKEWDFYQIVSNCIAQNQMFAKKKSQLIIFEKAGEQTKVLCDKDKIEQVINNLLSNAIKYSHDGKTIWIKVNTEDSQLVTRVIDEGKGIAEEELNFLFKDFQTTSTKSTAGEKSTGLGLAIVKKIIDSHKGKISARSTLGSGSEFSFSLPVSN